MSSRISLERRYFTDAFRLIIKSGSGDTHMVIVWKRLIKKFGDTIPHYALNTIPTLTPSSYDELVMRTLSAIERVDAVTFDREIIGLLIIAKAVVNQRKNAEIMLLKRKVKDDYLNHSLELQMWEKVLYRINKLCANKMKISFESTTVETLPNSRNKIKISQRIYRKRLESIGFDILNQIGSGESGIVYLGEYNENVRANFKEIGGINAMIAPLNGKRIAIKYFNTDGFSCKMLRELFKEADIITHLMHPNINRVEIIIFVNHSGGDLSKLFTKPKTVIEKCAFYVIDEYAPMGTLSNYFENIDSGKRNRFSENDAKYFCRQLADGLKYLHESDRTHSNIHSHNILLFWNDDSSRYVLKWADFGCSKYWNLKHITGISKLGMIIENDSEAKITSEISDLGQQFSSIIARTDFDSGESRRKARDFASKMMTKDLHHWKSVYENDWFSAL